MSIAEATIPTFLRVPAYARKVAPNLPATVNLLPMIKGMEDMPKGDVTFAVRLNETYMDVDALLAGERWFVAKACLRARRLTIVECADRDPLLVLDGFNEVENTKEDTTRNTASSRSRSHTGTA